MPKINSLATKQDELKALEATIAERLKYYRAQEKLINEMVETGNTNLMGLIHDVAVAKKQLRDLKTDIRTAAQDKVLLNEDLEQMRTEMQVGLGALPAFG